MSKTSNIVAGTMASSGAPASSVQNEAAELEQLTDSLQERLVNSGEWDKLVRQLRKSLDKSEWEDDLRKYARDQARDRNGQIHLNDMASLLEPHAKATIPQEVRDEMLNKLRAFVQNNVEE